MGLDEITRERLFPEAKPEPEEEEGRPIGFRVALPEVRVANETEPAKENEPVEGAKTNGPSEAAEPVEQTPATEPRRELTPRELIPSTEDLVEYGFMPELVGRITLRCRYNPITVDVLYNVLRNSNISPAGEFIKMFAGTQNRLVYTENALMEIARKAEKLRTGVRALRNVIGEITYPIYYELSDQKNRRVIITRKTVCGEAPPTVMDNPVLVEPVSPETTRPEGGFRRRRRFGESRQKNKAT